MSRPSDNESWLIEIGDDVIQKKAKVGIDGLTAGERLLYCVWVIDYCIRNSGDLVQVDLLHPNCAKEAQQLSERLSLPFAAETFSLSIPELEAQYTSRFEQVCDEVKRAQP